MRRDEAMSALTPTSLALFTSLPGTGKTTQPDLDHLLHLPTLARNIVEKDITRLCALEAVGVRP